MMTATNPIGIFDSGVGGLTVWKEIEKLLPNESIVYYADSINCPYGSKNADEVIAFSEIIVDFLLGKKCKIIIVACNTATAAAIDHLRKKYKISFVGMEPAIKPAALKTKTGTVGILATEGTFNGRLFRETRQKYAGDKEVIIQIGKGLVEKAEQGEIDSPQTRELITHYIQPMIDKGVDQIVLGCTHYPFFMSVIRDVAGNRAFVIDPAIAIARQTRELLKDNGLLNSENLSPEHKFFTNGNIDTFSKILRMVSNIDHEIEPV